MHELAIAQSLVEIAAREAARAGAGRISTLRCRIGVLRRIDDEMMRSAFEIARHGTPCAAATLVIERAPLRAECPCCCRPFNVQDWDWTCPDCGAEGEPLGGGDALELVAIEAEAGDDHSHRP